MDFLHAKPAIGLGTVQFGIPYGVHAHSPLMPEEEVQAILSFALTQGIRFFDTAANYGEAEARLGRFGLETQCPGVQIATKIPAVPRAVYLPWEKYQPYLKTTVRESQRRLGVKKCSLVQFHQCDLDFLQSASTKKAVHFLLEEGFCDSVGFSVYSPEEALEAIKIEGVSALQFPVNLLDRRFLNPGVLTRIRGKKLIARSVFLQGVLIPSAPLPNVACADHLETFKLEAQRIAQKLGQPLDFLALKFVCTELRDLSVVLLGVDCKNSLKSNLSHCHRMKEHTFPEIGKYFAELALQAEKAGILEPRSWNEVRQAA